MRPWALPPVLATSDWTGGDLSKKNRADGDFSDARLATVFQRGRYVGFILHSGPQLRSHGCDWHG